MAFETLTSRFQMALRRLTGKAKLTEHDIDEMMKEIRLSLLEADVNYKIVREFTDEVREIALGERIMKGLNPGDQVVKVVNEELVKLMGSVAETIHLKSSGLSVIMLAGLQGAGKTTTAGKLASFLRKNNEQKVLMAACDIYRPAAIEQLKTIGKQLDIEVFSEDGKTAVEIAKDAFSYANKNNFTTLIIDTAGRLHVNETLMDELKDIKKALKPDEILLTVDAMTGQDAVTVTQAFHEALEVTGCILTKLDGDTRGGAALSIRKVSGIPIKFSGTGEKLSELEVFHPERMASRILGMGDVLSLIEKAQAEIDEDEAMSMMEKMMSGKFNYNDLLKQMKMVKRMGALSGILKMLPGMSTLQGIDKVDDSQLTSIEAIIQSMTPEERTHPELIERSSSRRSRIARGCGKSTTDVNRLVSTLEKQKTMMQRLSGMNPSSIEKMASGGIPSQNQRNRGKGKGGFRI